MKRKGIRTAGINRCNHQGLAKELLRNRTQAAGMIALLVVDQLQNSNQQCGQVRVDCCIGFVNRLHKELNGSAHDTFTVENI
jgi:hypothetical protein